jgi:hypothetical protein
MSTHDARQDRSGPKEAASHRVTVPSQHPEYSITVTTEQTAPGTWKAVATVTHATSQSVQATPVPLADDAFPDADAARARAVATASEWIDRNLPKP